MKVAMTTTTRWISAALLLATGAAASAADAPRDNATLANRSEAVFGKQAGQSFDAQAVKPAAAAPRTETVTVTLKPGKGAEVQAELDAGQGLLVAAGNDSIKGKDSLTADDVVCSATGSTRRMPALRREPVRPTRPTPTQRSRHGESTDPTSNAARLTPKKQRLNCGTTTNNEPKRRAHKMRTSPTTAPMNPT